MYNKITEYDYERLSYIPDSSHDSFKILTGKYSGTIITFGEVAVTENMDGSDAKLQFQYQIEETPLDANEIQNTPELNNHLGDILSHILQRAIEDDNFKIGIPDGTEPTNDNT